MDNQNYILITGWMVKELKLRGSELLVYALIYGFSQDGESKFYGSRKYIAEWFNCSLPTIDKALNSLLNKGLIIKIEETINGVKFNRFKALKWGSKESLQGVKNLYRGSKESLQGGSKESLHNNTNIDNIEDILEYNISDNISNNKEKTFDELMEWLDV